MTVQHTADAVTVDGYGEPEVLVYAGDAEAPVLGRWPLAAGTDPGAVLAAAGWRVVGEWEPTPYGGAARVEPAAGTTGAQAAAYEAAAARVDATPELEPYRDVILAEWTEPGHYAWAASAPLAELVDWAAVVASAGDAGTS